jgi:phosphoglycolate phosphatase-like HAD superfamily hydrolase
MSEIAPARSAVAQALSRERRYDHVIWDWNGTLLDDVAFSVELMAQALGIDCALVDAGHQSAQRLRQKTSRVFTSLADLRALLGI